MVYLSFERLQFALPTPTGIPRESHLAERLGAYYLFDAESTLRLAKSFLTIDNIAFSMYMINILNSHRKSKGRNGESKPESKFGLGLESIVTRIETWSSTGIRIENKANISSYYLPELLWRQVVSCSLTPARPCPQQFSFQRLPSV
ncbi:hypothetical protein EVAR_8204_1 [Eumeta japonica]|uniref:Uncharacterized protein n=1 Tax=Eumeta variegata TaxID=151549 RepID=A0A4C1TI67_EUMVA|nr:hypothetical protein EVAR_8204_1 [Eumeta japonica]